MSGRSGRRQPLLLLVCPDAYPHRNAVTAALAWMAEASGSRFEGYYDAPRAGRHFGGDGEGEGLRHGGLMAGGRHLETLGVALQRFETTVFCVGRVAFANTLAALAPESGAEVIAAGEDPIRLYQAALVATRRPWPRVAVLLSAAPTPALVGADAYAWPEIFHRQALGFEMSLERGDLERLRDLGTREVLTCGMSPERVAELRSSGLVVCELPLIEPGDDHALFTARMARRWERERRGWMLADPVLASHWLPAAIRDRRAIVYGQPQSRVIGLLESELAAGDGEALIGRQQDDSDFFELSRLGRPLQLVDPGRPPLPVTLSDSPHWAPSGDPAAEDPTDAELERFAREGRILVSLLFWTGALRELENLYALTDLVAVSGLKAGMVLTADSYGARPSPIELWTVPRDQGGVFPDVEVLLGSAGSGVAIESLLGPERLRRHLFAARRRLEEMRLPPALRPVGWWPCLDVSLMARRRPRIPVRVGAEAPFGFQLRYAARPPPAGRSTGAAGSVSVREGLSARLRRSRLRPLFSAYRPYEHFTPGPLAAEMAGAVRDAGFSYMFTKGGFGSRPLAFRDGEFVALNFTAGRWDGWTPFETINDAGDLRRAEKALLRRGQPGWLVGTIDSCLWAFSGELWSSATRLAEIARFAAMGGASGKLVNVRPAVVARYARVVQAVLERSAA